MRLGHALCHTRLSGVCLLLALLAAWEASARLGVVVSENWPPFSEVLESFYAGVADGELLAVIGSTLWRMARGYAIGCALGVAVGVALALLPAVRLTLRPALELLRPIPAPVIIAPLMFLLGAEDALKIFVIAFATFFPVQINTQAGVLAVDRTYIQVARTFGVPRLATLWQVIWPAALPHVLAGMRISLAYALIVTVVAELLAGSHGVGYYVASMQYASRAADMYAAIIMLTAAGYLVNRAFLVFEARVIHWSRLRDVAAEPS